MNKSTFIIVIALVVVFGVITGYQNYKINTLESQSKIEVLVGGDIVKDSLIKLTDSLSDELFIRHIENGRYELTFEHFKEVNPKLGKEMEEWMSHETE